ncbi:MAG: winged helix-turn-helix transcriptional regulator [Pseudomonadota bacterium]
MTKAPARRPLVALLSLLEKRWVLRILWELRGDPMRFREIQARLGRMSPTILNERLAEMRAAGLVDLEPEGYTLTTKGRDLLKVFKPMEAWADRWEK